MKPTQKSNPTTLIKRKQEIEKGCQKCNNFSEKEQKLIDIFNSAKDWAFSIKELVGRTGDVNIGIILKSLENKGLVGRKWFRNHYYYYYYYLISNWNKIESTIILCPICQAKLSEISFAIDVQNKRDAEVFERIKKLVNAHTIITHDDNFNEWREIDMAYGHFVQEIDKIQEELLKTT